MFGYYALLRLNSDRAQAEIQRRLKAQAPPLEYHATKEVLEDGLYNALRPSTANHDGEV